MADASPSIPLLAAYGRGVYRRRILLESLPGRVLGELEDDFHHFGVDLRHDGERVTAARGCGLRVPWTTCGDATAPLEALRGLAVGTGLREGGRHTDPRRQCTHLLDVALLAAGHAGRRPGSVRRYDVAIPDRVEGRTRAELSRDGSPALAWQLEGDRIADPASFAGRRISDRDFGAFAAGLGGDLAEAAAVLRRAVFISVGRRYDFERMRRASEFGEMVGGACHTFSPGPLAVALRNPGTRRDFAPEQADPFGDGFSGAFRAFSEEGVDAPGVGRAGEGA